MNPGRIILIVFGSLLVLLGMGMGTGAAALGLVAGAQSDGKYLSVPEETYTVGSYAITSQNIDVNGVNADDDVASLQVRGTGTAGPLFIGIAPSAEVDRYLADVAHSRLDEVRFNPFEAEYTELPGAAVPEPPVEQDFWTVSSEGTGTQDISWPLDEGTWTVVVMNADGSPLVSAELQMGVRSDLIGSVAWWLFWGAVLLVVIGVVLILLAILAGRKHEDGRSEQGRYAGPAGYAGPGGGAYGYGPVGTGRDPAPHMPAPHMPAGARALTPAPKTGGAAYPARLYGELDPGLSRWMWLVKWFLAIPHFIVLAFLWIAFFVATVVAGFAILFTARYPRALFNFNVGVIRWSWRVTFYASGALGTDKYPPFSLDRENYPADFDVDYPEKLSRGLVLVKWWLLVIPQALVVAAFSGTSVILSRSSDYAGSWDETGFGTDGGRLIWDDAPGGFGSTTWWTDGISLLGLLVFIAAVALLFTRRYPRHLFDLVMGLQRWSYRVLAYTTLMRDEYPPFRLDQGPADVRDLSPAADGQVRRA